MARIKWSFRKTHRGSLPLRESCDPMDPRQALLWMFTGFALRGAPIPLPVEYWEELSEHIIECLGIPVDASTGRLLEPVGASLGWTPRRKYQPPSSVMNRAVAAGAWVTIDEPDPPRESLRDMIARMGNADQNAIADAVFERLGIARDEANELLPDRVPIPRLAKHLGLSSGQVVTLLNGWGVTDVSPRSWIDRGTALRVVSHYRRAQEVS